MDHNHDTDNYAAVDDFTIWLIMLLVLAIGLGLYTG